MSRYQSEVKSRLQNGDAERGGRGGTLSHCPHCGQSLAWEPEPERVRWYIADDGGGTPVSALGERLLASLRANGQAVYVSADGKHLRRMGIVAAADGEPIPPDERQPLIFHPEEFQRLWRRVNARPAAKTRAAGGAR
jgi:hypothetical protein